jgi:hypothetical protein
MRHPERLDRRVKPCLQGLNLVKADTLSTIATTHRFVTLDL